MKWFREVATVAGIPADVQSMDARAGGATEAGATLADIQGALTHSKQTTTLRYLRRRTKKIADVAEVRKQSRASNDDDGTA